MSNSLFVAWRSGGDSTGCWGPVGRLDRISDGYRFVYTRGARELPGFHPFPGMEDINEVYESRELLPLFENRLLVRSRPEYKAYLEWSGFSPAHPPDPIAILSVTEGRRVTDMVEVFPAPQQDGDGCYLTTFFVHGIRWAQPTAIERIAQLLPGQVLELRFEDDNPVDSAAVAVWDVRGSETLRFGYVPRYLAADVRTLHELLVERPELTVQRVNADAPLQFRLLCRLRACWPSDFRPCSGSQYQPIPEIPAVAAS